MYHPLSLYILVSRVCSGLLIYHFLPSCLFHPPSFFPHTATFFHAYTPPYTSAITAPYTRPICISRSLFQPSNVHIWIYNTKLSFIPSFVGSNHVQSLQTYRYVTHLANSHKEKTTTSWIILLLEYLNQPSEHQQRLHHGSKDGLISQSPHEKLIRVARIEISHGLQSSISKRIYTIAISTTRISR